MRKEIRAYPHAHFTTHGGLSRCVYCGQEAGVDESKDCPRHFDHTKTGNRIGKLKYCWALISLVVFCSLSKMSELYRGIKCFRFHH